MAAGAEVQGEGMKGKRIKRLEEIEKLGRVCVCWEGNGSLVRTSAACFVGFPLRKALALLRRGLWVYKKKEKA